MKKKKGQSLVETALIVPIVLLLFCGMVDFGRILYAQAKLNIVAQETVRMAGLGKKDYEIIQFAMDKVDPAYRSTLDVDPDPLEDDRTSGDYVTVTLTCDVNYITPFVKIIFPSPFKVKTKSTIRVE